MKDFYKTLGVERSASQDDIKKAFRKLAHQYHPDKQGGDEAKFKEVNEAYATLSDAEKRRRYDQFGSAGPGAGGPGGFGGFDFSNFDFSQAGGQGVEFDLGDIFSAFFGGRRAPRGRDVRVDVQVSFRDAVFGTSREVSYQRDDGTREKVTLDIPAGTDDGDAFRVPGKGETVKDGSPGNLIVRVRVQEHPTLRREGAHLVGSLEVKISDLVLGAEREFETLDGKVKVHVPEGSKPGELIRIKGKGGVAGRGRGDLFLRLDLAVPRKLSKAARAAAEALREAGE